MVIDRALYDKMKFDNVLVWGLIDLVKVQLLIVAIRLNSITEVIKLTIHPISISKTSQISKNKKHLPKNL